ncbi:anti-repressor SinI family protein [Paenibacillus sp. FSL K6-2524]
MLAGPHKVLVEDWINLMIEARNMGMTKEEVLRFIWQAKKVQAFPLALH